jgi:hypothetical protein
VEVALQGRGKLRMTAEFSMASEPVATVEGVGRSVSGAIFPFALVDRAGTGYAIAIRHEAPWVYSIGAGDTARADLRAAG